MKGCRSSGFIWRRVNIEIPDFKTDNIKMDELKHKLELGIVDKEATAVFMQLKFQSDNIDNIIVLNNVEVKPYLADSLDVRCVVVPGNGEIEYTSGRFEMIEGSVLGWWI